MYTPRIPAKSLANLANLDGWLPKLPNTIFQNTRQFVTNFVLAKSIYRVHLRAVRFLPMTDVCVFRPPHDSIVKAQASPTQPAVLGPP